MESPIVVDKPPEYYTNERGFPFDEDESTGAWSELASRHPDIAARLRQRPATWARKRRPSSQDGVDDSGDNFGSFDRFPFDDIPPEFREHFPSHWNRRFGSHDEQHHQPPSPQHQTAATQTEQAAGPSQEDQQGPIPQYGLRNTVDLGQKSAADPSLADTDDRSQRSMSAPPDNRTVDPNSNKMSGQNNQDQPHPPQQEQSNVRHIPIFVEGRDEPVINRSANHGNAHYAEPKPTYVPPQQPHVEREQYYSDEVPVGFPFSKSFDRPFFRQGPQPFTKQKMYPQSAFARGGSPQRSQSPKPSYQEHHVPRAETPTKPQQKQPPPPQQKQSPPQQKQPPRQQSPPAAPQNQAPPQNQDTPQEPPHHQPPSANDPISQILSIQTDVLNLMTEVENFTGTKRDKQYLFLDEMLTRNLIKLDNIETDGKENIRQARKEAIKCIQKCIAVLEAKADKRSVTSPQPSQDVEMQSTETTDKKEVVQNGDVEMKETKEESKAEEQPSEVQGIKKEEEEKQSQPEKVPVAESTEVSSTEQPQVPDTRPTEENTPSETQLKPDEKKEQTTEKKSPKKVVKKRDKSKDKKEAAKDSTKETVDKKDKVKDEKDTDKKEDINENIVNKSESKDLNKTDEKTESMQIDSKGDKADSQTMEVDGATSQ